MRGRDKFKMQGADKKLKRVSKLDMDLIELLRKFIYFAVFWPGRFAHFEHFYTEHYEKKQNDLD